MKEGMWMESPAAWWDNRYREGSPMGNGEIGALEYGGVSDDRVMVTHARLWWGARRMPLPDVSHLLAPMRELLWQGKTAEADKLYANELAGMGYDPSGGFPAPLCDIRILQPATEGFYDYRRELDFMSGESRVLWSDCGRFSRRIFVSRADDVVVMRMDAEGALLNATLRLEIHEAVDARMPRGMSELPTNVRTRAEEGYLYFSATMPGVARDFGAAARVMAEGGESAERDGDMVIKGARSITLLLKPYAGGYFENDWHAARQKLAELPGDYAALLARHQSLHAELMDRQSLDLSDARDDWSNEALLREAYRTGEAPAALVERMFHYGRYLLISSTRPGGLPCPLMGLWCGEYKAFWAFNMLNINLEMTYWHAPVGGLAEICLPVFDYYEARLDDLRENARKLFGCRGIYICAVSTPKLQLLPNTAAHIVTWTAGAAWLCQHYIDYYLYTGDRAFLRERALPMLRETALFYEDFLVEGADGLLHVIPSISPENNPGTFRGGPGLPDGCENAIDATMDVAVVRELLGNLLEYDEGASEAEKEKWRDMRKRLPAYQAHSRGAAREWLHDDYGEHTAHRHASHLYPVFPGNELARDEEWRAPFLRAAEYRLSEGLHAQSGWARALLSCCFARLQEGESAMRCLSLLTRACVTRSLLTLHNDWRGMGIGLQLGWAPFQIDANMGLVNAVQEMLFYSAPGRVDVLPALPQGFAKGADGPAALRGGIRASVAWDNGGGSVTLTAIEDAILDVYLPTGPRRQARLRAGVPETIKF